MARAPKKDAPFAGHVFALFGGQTVVTSETDVAEAVYRAATDEAGPLRTPAGPDAVALAEAA